MMGRGSYVTLLAAAAALLLVRGPAQARDEPNFIEIVASTRVDDARAFIESVGSATLGSLTDDTIDDRVREERFRKVLVATFDLPTIARFVLGRYWRIATKAQRTEFLVLFEDFLVQAYANQFKGVPNKFSIVQVREINASDQLVMTEVRMPRGNPIRINWRVRGPRNGRFRIIDVVFEGISMSVTQREEFASVIRARGGKMEGLLVALRQKTQKSQSTSAVN